jgi:3-phosphoshikimate 1-carboxyvinyltransferase
MSSAGTLPDPLEILPVTGSLDAAVRPPGSKSITNRALVCAGLAEGTTVLDGVLAADDTEAMVSCLRELGIRVHWDRPASRMVVEGCAGRPPSEGAVLDARLSGTTSRFVAPVAALARGTVVLDGGPPLRRRPMADLLDALERLGAGIEPLGDAGHLPVRVDASGLDGGRIDVAGDVSSQFLSALLLAAPCMRRGLEVHVSTELVSRPYVDMTAAVMGAFGAPVDLGALDAGRVDVEPVGYRSPERFGVEADASAASYFLAAAAIAGGRVRVDGVGTGSLQGDVAFASVLERMGVAVTRGPDHIAVEGDRTLRGIDVDMGDISDTAQTLAVVAAFADGPTVVRGIGFIRGKETDRIAAVVTELRRLGIDAREDDDGFTVVPGPVGPATVHTYDDHRMAMSFALLGLRAEGVRIADPGCVAKTYPGYWRDLAALAGPAGGGPVGVAS